MYFAMSYAISGSLTKAHPNLVPAAPSDFEAVNSIISLSAGRRVIFVIWGQ